MKPRVLFKLRGLQALQVSRHILKKQSNLLIRLFAYTIKFSNQPQSFPTSQPTLRVCMRLRKRRSSSPICYLLALTRTFSLHVARRCTATALRGYLRNTYATETKPITRQITLPFARGNTWCRTEKAFSPKHAGCLWPSIPPVFRTFSSARVVLRRPTRRTWERKQICARRESESRPTHWNAH